MVVAKSVIVGGVGEVGRFDVYFVDIIDLLVGYK